MPEDKKPESAQGIIRSEFERIENMSENGKTDYFSTGYHELDKLVTGFYPGSLWLLGGDPKAGKSTLLLNFADNICGIYDKVPYIFSNEMTKEEWTRKRLIKAGWLDNKLRGGQLRASDWAKLARAAGSICDNVYFMDDNSSPTPEYIMDKVREVKNKLGDCHLVGIDYMQRLKVQGKTYRERGKEIIFAAESMKTLAKELGIAIVLVSQLDETRHKQREKGIFSLSDFEGLERAADVAILINRPELYQPDVQGYKGWAELTVYSRHDSSGKKMRLLTDLEHSVFRNEDY